jgi:hypothetical protein
VDNNVQQTLSEYKLLKEKERKRKFICPVSSNIEIEKIR